MQAGEEPRPHSQEEHVPTALESLGCVINDASHQERWVFCDCTVVQIQPSHGAKKQRPGKTSRGLLFVL